MELKVVFYVLLALGWLVSKALAARQKSDPSAPEKVPAPKSSRPAGSGELPRELRERSGRRDPLSNKRSPDIPNRTMVSQRAEKAEDSTVFFLEGGQILDDNIPEVVTEPGSVSRFSENLADEIRSGNIDWRRQVIISELLTKKYV